MGKRLSWSCRHCHVARSTMQPPSRWTRAKAPWGGAQGLDGGAGEEDAAHVGELRDGVEAGAGAAAADTSRRAGEGWWLTVIVVIVAAPAAPPPHRVAVVGVAPTSAPIPVASVKRHGQG